MSILKLEYNQDDFNDKIVEIFKNCNSGLYMVSTQNLRYDIQNSELCGKLNNVDLYTFPEFLQNVWGEIYENGSYLSVADSRYILYKILQYKFINDPIKYNLFYKMRYELYDLYKFMMFYDVHVTDGQLEGILEDFSQNEESIFDIYSIYKDVINDVIGDIRGGKISKHNELILGKKFLKKTGIADIDTFSNKEKVTVKERLSGIDTIVLDGFISFGYFQKFIIDLASSMGINVYIIATESFSDNINIDKVIKSKAVNDVNSTNKLQYLQHNYNNFIEKPQEYLNNKANFNDDSVEILSPFLTREDEFTNIVKNISSILKENYKGDVQEIKNVLKTQIAVVIGKDLSKYQMIFDNILNNVGVFVFKGKEYLSKLNLNYVNDEDIDYIKEVYFSRDDFLNSEIGGVDFETKLEVFHKAFNKIRINRKNYHIAMSIVGRFVFELYNMAKNGITKDGFKNILYCISKNYTENTAGDSVNLISDFKYLERFLDDNVAIDIWIEEVKKLSEIKDNVLDNDIYKYHPIYQISYNTISLFVKILTELNKLVGEIVDVVGGVDSHLNMLKRVVDSFDTNYNNLELRQSVLQKIASAIEDIGKSAFIDSTDYKFFADNVKYMLNEWENDNSEDNENDMYLNLVSLDNTKKFKYVFMPTMEDDKYPRKSTNNFRLNGIISTILTDEKYGINLPIVTQTIKSQLDNDRNLFNNVLNFTTNKLVFSYVLSEYQKEHKASIYINDLFNIFGNSIKYKAHINNEFSGNAKFTLKTKECKIPGEYVYSLTNLAIFKLCPKFYYYNFFSESPSYLNDLQLKFYAEAVIYCDFFIRFSTYNINNKKVYPKWGNEHKAVVSEIFEECFNENIKNFTFLTKYEKNDIKNNVINKILGFIDNGKRYIKGNNFTIIDLVNKVYEGIKYEINIEHDNRFVDYDKRTYRMNQNNLYLEFLVLKTTNKKSSLTHYDEMIAALNNGDKSEDRINLLIRMIAKINIQFDSKSFELDGLTRVDNLVDEVVACDFAKVKPMVSNYCIYCKYYNICMSIA